MKDKSQTETVHSVIPAYVRDELQEQANDNDKTMSWIIKEICTRFVDERMKVVSGTTYIKVPKAKKKPKKRKAVKC